MQIQVYIFGQLIEVTKKNELWIPDVYDTDGINQAIAYIISQFNKLQICYFSK